MGAGVSLSALGGLGAIGSAAAAAAPPADDLRKAVYKVSPIGKVHNKKGRPVRLEIFDKYIPALHRLAYCSHVMVVWWFHKNDTPEKRAILKVHPQGNKKNPLTGVFATHSPVRPNLIALTTCKVLSVQGGIVTIDRIDAFDGTPILDLKSAGQRRRPKVTDKPDASAR